LNHSSFFSLGFGINSWISLNEIVKENSNKKNKVEVLKL